MRRVIFENSFQYQQARDLEVNTYEAQLEEIGAQLSRTDLDASTRANLEAQESSIRVLLRAGEGETEWTMRATALYGREPRPSRFPAAHCRRSRDVLFC